MCNQYCNLSSGGQWLEMYGWRYVFHYRHQHSDQCAPALMHAWPTIIITTYSGTVLPCKVWLCPSPYLQQSCQASYKPCSFVLQIRAAVPSCVMLLVRLKDCVSHPTKTLETLAQSSRQTQLQVSAMLHSQHVSREALLSQSLASACYRYTL